MNYSRSISCVELINMIILTLLCFLSSLNKFCERMTCYYQTVRRCSFVSSAKNKNESNDCFLFTDRLVQLKTFYTHVSHLFSDTSLTITCFAIAKYFSSLF